MCQERPNVDVSFRPFLICCLRIVDDSDEPVAVSPDVKYHISVDVVGIPKHEMRSENSISAAEFTGGLRYVPPELLANVSVFLRDITRNRCPYETERDAESAGKSCLTLTQKS